MEETVRVAIAGGGTGGHLFPALNLGQAMEERWQAQLLFFGTERGSKIAFCRKRLPSGVAACAGLAASIHFKNLTFPLNLVRSLSRSKRF